MAKPRRTPTNTQAPAETVAPAVAQETPVVKSEVVVEAPAAPETVTAPETPVAAPVDNSDIEAQRIRDAEEEAERVFNWRRLGRR